MHDHDEQYISIGLLTPVVDVLPGAAYPQRF